MNKREFLATTAAAAIAAVALPELEDETHLGDFIGDDPRLLAPTFGEGIGFGDTVMQKAALLVDEEEPGDE
jgi:hypothetical protein